MDSEPGLHPFDEVVRRPVDTIRLAEAALQFARDEYPAIKPVQYLQRLDALARRVDCFDAHGAADRVESLRTVLVEGLGLRGNRVAYADPANSYLNRVLDTRRGIPISVAAVWLDIGATLGWPLTPVSLPGHFIIAYEGTEGRVLLDPFNQGRELSVEDCGQIVTAMFGGEVSLTREHLEPAGTLGVLERMLGNLYSLYANAADWRRTVRVLQRLTAVRPDALTLWQELGRVSTLAGQLDLGAEALARARRLALSDSETSALDALERDLRQARLRIN